jgi:polar amino acid transport system substrate-binding protein
MLASAVQANESLVLSNDAWPPFILEGEERGTAEKLVCQALERSGWTCTVRVDDWEDVLEAAKSGTIDGIAAAWRNPDRETYLLFSEPYLTNRIVPVIDSNKPAIVETVSDLTGLRVALVADYAYGDEIEAMGAEFDAVKTKNTMEAILAVRDGRADLALVDELVARDVLERSETPGIRATDTVLAFRSLHFAVPHEHPRAEEIIADFHRAYELMLNEGAVNEILNIDWLATDFGHHGQIDLVMRSGVSLDELSNPTEEGSVYALERSEYQLMRQSDLDPARVNYQAGGNSHTSLQSALNSVFGKDVCKHKEYSSEFDCTNLFKK